MPELSSESSSDDEEEMTPASELRYRLENISDIVQKLVKIAVAIRKSGLKARNLRADAWEDKDEDGLNRTDLFEQSFRLILEKRYGLTDPLRSRICVAVCRQKHRIKYRRAHQEHLSFRQEFELTHQERQLHAAPQTLFPTSEIYTEIKEGVKFAQSRATQLSRHTEATKYTKIESEQRSLASGAPSSRISSNSHTLKATIPEPPLVKPGMRYFQCPYCCILVPREKAESIRKWR